MKVVLDLDDFSLLRSRFDLLETIKEHFPNFKASLFTIPFDYEAERTHLRVNKEEAKKRLMGIVDWAEFIPHGLTHIPREFENCDQATMESYLDNVEIEMRKVGYLHTVKGFKAPQWLWNQAVVEVLNARGWWGAVDRNQPKMMTPKKLYRYSYSLDEPFWQAKEEIVKIHGHISLPSKNNLEDCLLNLFKLPSDVSWHFASEFVEDETA